MTLSVQTNASALVALQNLNRTNTELENVQTRINTGLKVSGAKENASVFAVAQGLRSDLGALEAVSISLDRAVSIGDVALAAGEAISDLLIEMRAKATAALDPSIDTFSRSAFDSDFKALLDQLRVVVTNAEFDGANLLNGSIPSGIQFLADADASRTITLNSQNFSISGAIITIPNNQSLSTVTLAGQAVSFVQASLENVNQALANLGSDLKKIESHREFVTRLNDTLTVGVGNLVDADLARESARLQSLQVKQQLGVQTLSIANSQPQIILGLFGG
jgi:flagellin